MIDVSHTTHSHDFLCCPVWVEKSTFQVSKRRLQSPKGDCSLQKQAAVSFWRLQSPFGALKSRRFDTHWAPRKSGSCTLLSSLGRGQRATPQITTSGDLRFCPPDAFALRGARTGVTWSCVFRGGVLVLTKIPKRRETQCQKQRNLEKTRMCTSAQRHSRADLVGFHNCCAVQHPQQHLLMPFGHSRSYWIVRSLSLSFWIVRLSRRVARDLDCLLTSTGRSLTSLPFPSRPKFRAVDTNWPKCKSRSRATGQVHVHFERCALQKADIPVSAPFA